jgi:hypothetical protein
MIDHHITKLHAETLQQLESQCSSVVAEICRSVSCNSDLVIAIQSVMGKDDVASAIDSLQKTDPALARSLITAAFLVS